MGSRLESTQSVLTPKALHAVMSLRRWLGADWEQAGLAKAKGAPACKVRLDRLEFTAPKISEDVILGIRRFRRTAKHFLRRKKSTNFLPYRRLTKFVTDGTIREMTVLSEPQFRHVAPCKATMLARDESGLHPTDVLAVMELIPDTRIVRMEVAFDFGSKSGVDCAFVRAHALFGKSRPSSVCNLRAWDSWGTRKGAKFVRSYFKEELGIHRLELQLNRKFLRRFGIDDIFDFRRLVENLPMNHIWFAEIDNAKMRHHLRMSGHCGREFWRILERVADGSGDLYEQCSVLRKRGKLKNVRRVLRPRTENGLVRDALKNWASQWPKVANRLEAK